MNSPHAHASPASPVCHSLPPEGAARALGRPCGARIPQPPQTLPATVDKRRALIGLAHKAATLAGLDDETRRAVQVEVTGKESCGEMTQRELLALLRHYKAKGVQIYIPNTAPLGRITAAQRATIDRLAAAIGLDDGQLQAFIARTAKVDSVEFLRKSQASAVISGLQRWADQRGADTRSRTRAAIETLLADGDADSEGGEV